MTAFIVVFLVLFGIGCEISRIISSAVIHDSLDKVDLPAGTRKKIMNW